MKLITTLAALTLAISIVPTTLISELVEAANNKPPYCHEQPVRGCSRRSLPI
jgi:hypothetical protein